MATFRDTTGREWLVTIDTFQLWAVRRACDFELGKLLADDMARLRELSADPVRFCSVLFVLVADQAKAAGVTEGQFMRAMAGDCLADAHAAFWRAYADFSPSHLRPALLRMAEKDKALAAMVGDHMTETIERIDPADLIRTLKRSAGNSGESSASIPEG